MFTEGLDETSINWIKQGLEVKQEPPRLPLTERFEEEISVPRSPLGFKSGTYTSSHTLPPLKFHSGLLLPHKTVNLSLDESIEDSDIDDESVGSAPNNAAEYYSDEEMFTYRDFEYSDRPLPNTNLNRKPVSSLNKGFLKEDLSIKLPTSKLKFGRNASQNIGTDRASAMPHSTYDTPNSVGTNDFEDFRTPSAPPMFDIGEMGKKSEDGSELSDDTTTLEELERDNDIEIPEKMPNYIHGTEVGVFNRKVETADTEKPSACGETKLFNNASYYNASGQNAWQVLVSYDACVRLCLNAWARGCAEAPEFLRDECLVLRSAFGLHNYVLQPRGAQPAVKMDSASKAQTCPLKLKEVIGKIKVEVKKIRVKRRQELKSVYSLRSAMNMQQVGLEYVRHVSSLVKSHINSLKAASFAVAPQERFSCLIHLKSSTEDSLGQSEATIRLRPGTGDCYDFFPENQNDALVLEIQDTKKSFHGRAVISMTSLTDNVNLNDRVRWWPLYHEDEECVGKVKLSIGSTITADEAAYVKNGPIVETLAYDLLMESVMRAQHFSARKLRIDESWKWLLSEFADYYGVSDSYTKLRYLSYIINVATPTKNCLELVYELLEPIMKAKIERNLTRQEKSLLMDCETQVESLLATVFENYKSLDENSPTGLVMGVFGLIQDVAAPAIAHAVKVYVLLHDILVEDSQIMLRKYLQTAAARRCRKHMMDTDEFISKSEGFLVDDMTISTAYLKMKNLCLNITNEIQADIKIHNQNLLPSSIDLSSITAAVYNTELCKRIRTFLAAWPPSCPSTHVNELLKSSTDFERNLQSWNISPVQGGVDSRNLYHDYIMVWVEDMQLNLLDLCKAEKVHHGRVLKQNTRKYPVIYCTQTSSLIYDVLELGCFQVPWSGVVTNHSTSSFAEEMYEKIKQMLTEYEVVMTRWPQYSLVLENAIANVERAIVKAMEKQYNDILMPFKDSLPKRLGIQVQKLTRRESNALYTVPSQLGTFLNTIKRIIDILHCKVEDILRLWASNLPVIGDKKSFFGEQMNGVTVMLRTKYKNYMHATIEMLINNIQGNRSTRLKRILEETKESDGESDVRERMQMLNSQLIDFISNLHEVFTSQIFVAMCRGLWDRMGQIVLRFLEGRKENRVWYNGSYYALGILDDTCASQMQRLQGNALQDKDLEPPRSINEARSILSRDSNCFPGYI